MTYPSNITKEQLDLLPPLVYENHDIVVVDTLQKAKEAFYHLQQSSLIGFDTETKPSFSKGVNNKVALVQLSAGTTCWLFRVNLIGFPKELVDILTDKTKIKVGVSLHDDFHSLARCIKMEPQGFIDLQTVISRVGIEDLSLQKMYGIIFGKKISKAQRLTNWEAPELTVKQQLYAAIDAWTCIDIYQQIKDVL